MTEITIEQAIKTLLLNKKDLTDIVDRRINYSMLPQGSTYPHLTFFRYSNPVDNDIDLAHTYLQFDSWALTYIEAINLAKVLRSIIKREKGIFSGIEIKQISFIGEGYNYEPDTKLHHVDNNFKVVYFEV
jgi:hypothetical protein